MSLPGTRLARKLDAIDTDQITPAADCVSESLDTLDERWKAGSFRYLMPGLPRPRAQRGDLHHRRRPVCDRLLARDEPGRTERCRGRSRSRDGGRLRREHGGHLPPQCVQPRTARGAESRGGGRRPRRRCLQLRSRHQAVAQRHAGQDLHAGAAVGEGRGDPQERRHLRRRPARVRRLGPQPPVARLGPAGAGRADDHHRADRLGASRRQGSAAERAPPGRDAARLRRPASGLGRHRAVCDPHLQPDHRRTHDLPAPGSHRQRSLRLHRRRGRRQADRASAARSPACTASSGRITRRRATASSTSTFPNRA